MLSKRKVGLIFGGPGPENEISIISAKSIFENFDHSKFEFLPILMNSDQRFFWIETNDSRCFQNIKSSSNFDLDGFKNQEIFFVPNGFWADCDPKYYKIDAVFNIVHGFPGEDGVLSGFFEMLKIPCVGSNVLSSSVSMDKEFSTIIAKHYSVEILDFETCRKDEAKEFEYYFEKFGGLPFFLKSATAGSSRGVYKITSKNDFEKFLPDVFKFNKKVIIQKGLEMPLEVEVAALKQIDPETGDEKILISNETAEIRPSKKHGFYSYDAKYLDEDGAELIVCGKTLNKTQKEKIFKFTEKLMKIFDCLFARVDFFFEESSSEIFFNELNTLPGFTSISMFPALFQKSGINYMDLISLLIENAVFESKMK